MITQRQFIKSENPVALGASFCSLRRRSSSSASIVSVPAVEMPMKLEERLNELESNAVKALLSLGEAFVSQSPYRAVVKKQPEPLSVAYVKALQPHQQQQHNHPNRSVIVKAEPILPTNEESRPSPSQFHHQQSFLQQRINPSSVSLLSNGSGHQNQYVRELGSTHNGLTFNNQQSTIRLASSIAPNVSVAQKSSITTVASPVSIQPAVSSSSPMISTIFYQIPATAASSTNGTNGTVMSPSFTIIPAPNGRVIPLPMVTTSSSPLVKIEPSTVVAQNGGTVTPVTWNNIQLLKVPRTSIENANGLATFSTLAPVAPPAPTTTKLLPSPPGRGEGKSLPVATPPSDGKSPTKSRARRRSQSTTKGQSRSSRVSSSASNSSDFVICPSVEGLPNIVVDGYEISREIWAKAFLQNDIIHAAGTLFNALFSSEEIKNCTLNGRNGTRQLCPEKRHAIFKIVAWMKNKCQDPYSFNKSPEETKILNREEQMMIEKKVFVERRYQTSRKIRDLPSAPPPPPTLSSSAVMSSVVTAAPSPVTQSKPTNSSPNSCTKNNLKAVTMTSVPVPVPASIQQRRDSGSFSSICSDSKGIPKIALLQSSEIIANYFQSADPLPLATSTNPINNHQHDGPPPLKMQKVG